ncbi:MAG: WcaI family glycosyltransferase [Deltaproteobacteria bacterium]|nr:WcaI family glycosyltransferase [Deltaproteobacteria bacterium]
MKLLIHGMNYAPELVGIGKYTGELGAYLASRGHQVTVLAAAPYYPQWRVQEDYRPQRWRREWLDGVEVLRVPQYVPARVTGKGRLLQEISFTGSCLYWWSTYLLGQPWDVMVAVCPPMTSGLVPGLLAKRRDLPLVIHVQDLQLDAARELGMLSQPVLLHGLAGLERRLFRRAQAVTTISRSMAERLAAKGVPGSRLHLLPNWADLENIRPESRQNDIRRELGLTSETVVLYAGNLGVKQGLEVVLQAAVLTREEPSIRYLMAGEGAARERLMWLAQNLGLDNLGFLPLQSDRRFPLLLAAADIHLVVQRRQAADLVMPSKLPNIMAAGRPFIATADAGTELGRVANESQAGLLTPAEDAGSLAQAIRRLATDSGLRKRLAVQGRQYAEAHWGREQLLRQWEELLLGLSTKA